MTENKKVNLEYGYMARWIVPNFQVSLPLNMTHFFPTSQCCCVCVEGLLHIVLQLVLDSYNAVSNHAFQNTR